MWCAAMRKAILAGEEFTRYRFAEMVAAAEREACARVCDALVKATHPNEEQVGPGSCAAAIRARGDA
jgi:hypothetical protein